MKKKGSESDTLNHRNHAILKIFRDKKRDCRYDSFYAICKDMSTMPVNRYYISEAMAVIIWSRWRKTGTIPNSKEYKRKLYTAFVQECERVKAEYGGSNRAIIRVALEMPAPCLGICPLRIFAILKQMGQK